MKSWFFKKVKKTDKPLAKLIKDRDRIQMNKIRQEKVTLQQNFF